MSLVVRDNSRALIGTGPLLWRSPRSKPFSLTAIFLFAVSWGGGAAFPSNALADNISDYWDRVYAAEAAQPVQPAPPSSSAPIPPAGQSNASRSNIQDLSGYLTFRYGIEYTRNLVTFTDRPTRTFVVDGQPSLSPGAIPGTTNFPTAFDKTDERLYSYMSLGTRALGSSRLSTYVSLVTYHDLDGTPSGSPFITTLDGLNGRNRTDLINAYADINGLTKEGPLSQVSARLGRQFAFDYDSWLLGSAVIDGVSLNHKTEDSDLTTFFGWREAFFADPTSNFTTGGSWTYRLQPRTSARIDFFHYQGSQRYAVGLKHRFDTVYTDVYASFINTDPIEFGSRVAYSSPDNPWSIYASFLQQLSANDFVYDIWYTSRDKDRIRRLNLFRISPASQFSLDIDRQIVWWLSVGVGGQLRFLNDGGDQGPFDTAYQEGSVRMLLTPLPQWDYFAQYRFRHIEHGPGGNFRQPFPRAITSDVSRSGETSYQEVNAEASYRWQNRLRVSVGGYYRLIDAQTPYVRLTNIDTAGLYAGFRVYLTQMIEFRFQYGVDNDYQEFNPDIDLAHTFRMGLHFRYN